MPIPVSRVLVVMLTALVAQAQPALAQSTEPAKTEPAKPEPAKSPSTPPTSSTPAPAQPAVVPVAPPSTPAPAPGAALPPPSVDAAPQSRGTEYRLDDSGNWVRVAAPEDGSDGALIAAARRALAEDRPTEARTSLDAWLEANERSRSPYLPEALVLRGDALTALGKEWDALYDYERVIKEFAATDQYVLAVERELDIGVRYVNGLKRRFLGVRVLPNEDSGEELLIRVQERMPGSRLAERAGIELADYYYNTRQLELASQAYELFVENYPNSQYAMKARQRRIYSIIGRYKGPRYDGSSLLDSKILVKRFSSLYPAESQAAGLDDGLVVRLDESSAQEMLEQAKWYSSSGDDVSARFVYRRILSEHPRTTAAASALETLQAKGWALEDETLAARKARQQKKFDEAERKLREATKKAEEKAKGTSGGKPAESKPAEPKPTESKPTESKTDAKESRP